MVSICFSSSICFLNDKSPKITVRHCVMFSSVTRIKDKMLNAELVSPLSPWRKYVSYVLYIVRVSNSAKTDKIIIKWIFSHLTWRDFTRNGDIPIMKDTRLINLNEWRKVMLASLRRVVDWNMGYDLQKYFTWSFRNIPVVCHMVEHSHGCKKLQTTWLAHLLPFVW